MVVVVNGDIVKIVSTVRRNIMQGVTEALTLLKNGSGQLFVLEKVHVLLTSHDK